MSVDNPPPKFFTNRPTREETSLNGKTYYVVYLKNEFMGTALLGRDYFPIINGLSGYDPYLAVIIHELGHALGLGVPEWYALNFTDNSGTLPNLGAYDFQAKFPEDPMSGADDVKYGILQYVFSTFNSEVISKNFALEQIASIIRAMQVKIEVVNASGQPVPNATVVSWGGVNNLLNTPQAELETLTTDANGLASLTVDDFYDASFCSYSCWDAKIIKASSGSLFGGTVLTVVDLQMAYWMENKDEFILTVTIQ